MKIKVKGEAGTHGGVGVATIKAVVGFDRFWEKVDKSGGPDACWPWTAGHLPDGRGLYEITPGNKILAPRHAYDLTHPDAPLGELFALHSCDNPPCCNPKHLRPGTNAENLGEMAEKGRARGGRKTKDGREPKNRRSPVK